jgi:hypothetical protein
LNRRIALALLSALCATSQLARAQATDTGAAEALFQSGKSLLEQKNYAQACPKLVESYRLDAGTGTLLALALCHEGEGRLASAWGEFADVAVRSRREGRADREEVARQHKALLEPRLSMLTVSPAPGAEQIDGLQIQRDGVEVGSGSWTTPVPVDPGPHHVEASAPGRKPFSATVTLAADGAREIIVVPILERAPERPDAAAGGAPRTFWTPLRYAGLAVGGAGAVGLAIGAVFGIRAITLNNDSKGDCSAQSICGASGYSLRHQAQEAGNVSTVAFVAGGVLFAAGATLFVVAKPREGTRTGVRAAPLVSGREVGIGLEGAF